MTWQDGRNDQYSPRIYAQHVLASGVVAPSWTTNGTLQCDATGAGHPTIVADGAGGAIVTWHDNRGGVSVYAQHVMVSGVIDPGGGASATRWTNRFSV